jgi:hypothetical protein
MRARALYCPAWPPDVRSVAPLQDGGHMLAKCFIMSSMATRCRVGGSTSRWRTHAGTRALYCPAWPPDVRSVAPLQDGGHMLAHVLYIVQHGTKMSGRWLHFKKEDTWGHVLYIVLHCHQMSGWWLHFKMEDTCWHTCFIMSSMATRCRVGGSTSRWRTHAGTHALYCPAWTPDVRSAAPLQDGGHMLAHMLYIVQHGHKMSGRWLHFKKEDTWGHVLYIVLHCHQMSGLWLHFKMEDTCWHTCFILSSMAARCRVGGSTSRWRTHAGTRALYCPAWPPDVRSVAPLEDEGHMLARALYCLAWSPDVMSVVPIQDGGHIWSHVLYCSAWPPDVRSVAPLEDGGHMRARALYCPAAT